MLAWGALSMPLLESADRVTMLTVTGGPEVLGPSAREMIRYLQLNGVRSQQLTVELGEQTTGECVLDTARRLDCDLLIKGAFTQNRLRQMIFGGATQHIMARATLPVLLAH
jgi:nucleotide-binding universal stress UspA family protein